MSEASAIALPPFCLLVLVDALRTAVRKLVSRTVNCRQVSVCLLGVCEALPTARVRLSASSCHAYS